MKSYDVIVVGAGTAGAIAARFCAKYGLNVCLIDAKSKERIGDKICGDGCGVKIFEDLKINQPQEEVLNRVKGFRLWAPNLKSNITVNDLSQTAYVVDRLKLGQRLLNEALDTGVTDLYDNTTALDFIYKEGLVRGISARKEGQKQELEANIVIDASGIHSRLRQNIKSEIIEKKLSENDAVLCYREIIKLKNDKVKDQDYLTLIKDVEKSPGGIIWYFPRGENSVNLGLGVLWKYCKNNKGTLRERYKKYVADHFLKNMDYETIHSAGMIDPLRRVLWSCADNGVMFAGDAAFHVNPVDGGGIDPSMRAGFYAANAAKEAHEREDFTLKGLWNYNLDIMNTFGADFAALDIQRSFYETLSNEDQNFILEKGILTGEDFAEITIHGTIQLSIGQLISKIFKGISKPGFMLKFNWLRMKLNKMVKHYHNYPHNFKELDAWKKETMNIYDQVQKKFLKE